MICKNTMLDTQVCKCPECYSPPGEKALDPVSLLAAVIRKERELICETIGNELDRLKNEDNEITSKIRRLWELRAELLRDKDREASS
jgi:hypothetical protein